MADYIDREKLQNKLSESLNEARKVPSQAQWKTGLLRAMFLLRSMPSVDTERHAHWIEEKTETGRKVYCSNCKSSAPFVCIADNYYGTRMHGEIQKTKCCPDCGAKMDEVEE